MIQKTFTIKDSTKFDVELATNIVNTLSDFRSKVIFLTSKRTADANSIINLMTLSLDDEIELSIEIDGDDANYTFNELEELLTKSGLI